VSSVPASIYVNPAENGCATWELQLVITVRTKKRVAGAEVCWRDNTSHVVEIVHRTDDSTVWFTWEVENLTRLIDEVADQVNMSAPLPNRTWHPSV